MATSSPATRAQDVGIDNCAREPIHIPGSVQPHGVLFAVDDDFVISHVSESAVPHLGRTPSELLGTSFADLMAADDLTMLKAALLGDLAAANPLSVTVLTAEEPRAFDAILHHSGQRLIIELEPVAQHVLTFQSSFHAIRSSVNRLNASGSLLELAQATAEEIRNITAFDRVMIYRFDREYNGEVIAEDKREDLSPFLGLHYPSTDIPAQARALYEHNWLRIIPDARYSPAPILAADSFGGGPLDLSGSVLRSVSPVHCEYLANMGVVASMSVSLIDREKLWGLIACHHYDSALYVPYASRAAAEFLGQSASMLLAAKEADESYEAALTVRSVQSQLLDALAREDPDAMVALTHLQPTVADLVGARGAVVCLDGRFECIGDVPDRHRISQLATWVWSRYPEDFATDSLANEAPEFADLAPIASGVIAVSLDPRQHSWIMWFRPETPQTVTWAGDPRDKPMTELADGSMRLSPRHSFEAWVEELHNRATPWTSHELRGATELGRRVQAQLSRSWQDQADVARTLQRGLTLAEIPEVPRLHFEARYQPSEGGLVGGDWYDVVPLQNGTVAVSIGDVAGHGLVAAATMGQLRSGLRAYLVEEVQPNVAIARLNRLVHWLLPNDLATGIVGIVDAEAGLLRLSSAGHLPPVLVRDGRASLVQTTRAPALGISETARYAESALELKPGDLFIVYTDGLVESRTESLDVGFDRLLQSASSNAEPSALIDGILQDLHRPDSTDDIAILMMQYLG